MANNQESIERNPYVEGRREWNERYGGYIKQAAIWRWVAFLSLLIAMIAVAGVVYIGSQNKITPYIVELDKIGNAVTVGPAERTTHHDSRVIKHMLADFITSLRKVYSDPKIQRDYIFQAYKYLSSRYKAYETIGKFYQDNSPFEKLREGNVEVTIESILSVSERTWQVDWNEIKYNKLGEEVSRSSYRALITIVISPPQTKEQIYKNPIGLYVKDITWTRIK